MSSDADSAAAAIVALFDALYEGGYCGMAGSVLVIYEGVVTLDREVTCFWAAGPTGASFLFTANKWISIVLYITCLVEYGSLPSDKRSVLYLGALVILRLLQFVPGAVFSALCSYVLSSRKRYGLLVFTLSMSPVGANLVVYGYNLSGENLLPFGCFQTDNTTGALDLRLVIISRVPVIVADILLIYTCTKLCAQRGTLGDMRKSNRLSLSDVLFRGGAIYFGVLLLFNVLHLIVSVLVETNTVSWGLDDFTAFTAPLTTILASRFLLELQEANKMVIRGVDSNDPLHTSRGPYDTDRPSFISSPGPFVNPELSAPCDDESEWRVGSLSGREEEGGAQNAASSSAAA